MRTRTSTRPPENETTARDDYKIAPTDFSLNLSSQDLQSFIVCLKDDKYGDCSQLVPRVIGWNGLTKAPIIRHIISICFGAGRSYMSHGFLGGV